MITFLISLIVIFALCFIVRMLRLFYIWVDYVGLIIMIGVPIFAFIRAGFWPFIVTLIATFFAICLIFGFNDVQEIEYKGQKYKIKRCKRCGYEEHDVIESDNGVYFTICQRCGMEQRYDFEESLKR